jgi:hypothetical protein
VHPSFKDKFNVSECCTKLTDWKVVNADDATGKETRVYATMIKNERGTLSTHVVVNWYRVSYGAALLATMQRRGSLGI